MLPLRKWLGWQPVVDRAGSGLKWPSRRRTSQRDRQARRERRRAAIGLELLEPRIVFSFTPLEPLGGLIQEGYWFGNFDSPGQTRQHPLELSSGQTLAGLLEPTSGTLRARVEVTDQDGWLLGTFDASGAGDVAAFQSLVIDSSGTYQVFVTSLDGIGDYQLRLLLNADGEEEVFTGISNDTRDTAQDISGSRIDLGNGSDRLAFVGQIGDTGDLADLVAFDLTAGQTASLVVSTHGGRELELFSGAGERLAIGLHQQFNEGPAIRDFVALETGTYFARVSGDSLADYRLLVTRGTGFEQTTETFASNDRPIGSTGKVLGYVGDANDPIWGTALLPIDFYDAAGYLWDIQSDGSISNGTSDAVDSGFHNPDLGTQETTDLEADGWEVMIGPFPLGNGLLVSRKIFVSQEEGFARFLDIYTNEGSEPISHPVDLYTNLGSDGDETVIETSSGDQLVTTDDRWLVTEDNRRFDPSFGHVIGGPDGLAPHTFSRDGDAIHYGFELPLEPGETRIIMSFGVQDFDTQAVLNRSHSLAQVPGYALAFMSEFEVAAVANFAISRIALDWHSIRVVEPTTLSLSTTMPLDGPGAPDHDLRPSIELYAPDGSYLGTAFENAVDGRNAELSHMVTEPGIYRVAVASFSGNGAYTLNIQTSEPGAIGIEPFTVVTTSLEDGAEVAALPTGIEVAFSDAVLLPSLQASDLVIIDPLGNVHSAAAVTVVGGDRVLFDLAGVPEREGAYQLVIAAGALSDLRGQSIEERVITFHVSQIGPVVISATPADGAVVDPGMVSFVATFDRPLRVAELGPEDVTLTGVFHNRTLAPSTFIYDAEARRLTVAYAGLEEDLYELRLLSGAGRFESLIGQALDGDDDGAAGGDYVTSFSVQSSASELPLALSSVEPLGSLIYSGNAAAVIYPAADVDVYSVELDPGQLLSLAVTATATLRPRVELIRQADGQIIGQAEATDVGQAALLSNLPIVVGGAYLISISGGTASFTTGKFDLTVALNAAFEAEPFTAQTNDSLATAEDLDASFRMLTEDGARGAVLGELPSDSAGVDWYAFSLEANQTTTLALTGTEGVPLAVDVFGPTGQRLAASVPLGRGAQIQQLIPGLVAPETGTYYAAVSGSGRYALVVTRDLAQDTEPNTRVTDAQRLSPDRAAVGNLGSNDAGAAGGTIRVALLRASFMSANVQLADDSYFDFEPVLVNASQIDTVEELSQYDVVVIGDQSSRSQLVTIAPALRAWVEAGGGVVGTGWLVYAAGSTTGTPINDINAIIPVRLNTSYSWNFNGTLAVVDSSHPVTQGVENFTATYIENSALGAEPWAQILATTGGRATAVVGEPGLGRSVYLGPTFSESGGSYPELRSGAADRLFEQAVAWAAQGGVDNADQYRINVRGGDQLNLFTATPGDGVGEPANDLDTLLELYNPSGTLVASNNNWPTADGGDGRNARILYTVPEGSSGSYRIRVSVVQGSGDYTLQVLGATGSEATPLNVSAASIAEGVTLTAWPESIVLDFSTSVLLSSVQAADLTVNGVPAGAVAIVDGNTLSFDISGQLQGDGPYTIGLAAGALRSLAGEASAAYSLNWTLDSTSPVVIASSIFPGAIVEPGDRTYTVSFSEPLDASGLGPEDIALVEAAFGTSFTPTAFAYDSATATVTASFRGLYDGSYLLTLASGPTAFRDRFGNRLNGSPSNAIPSGQGDLAPDDFVLSFVVDAAADEALRVPLRPLAPLGGLIHESTEVRGVIHDPADADAYSLGLDPSQTVTVVVAALPTLRGRVELIDPDGNVIGSTTATAAGDTIVLQTVATTVAGTYRIRILGVDGTAGGYSAKLLLNSAVQASQFGGVGNRQLSTAQDLTGGLVEVGNGIGQTAVVGQPGLAVGEQISVVRGTVLGAPLVTLQDGVFQPRGGFWTVGTVYWNGLEPELEINFGEPQTLTGLRVQADNNDTYQLDWLDPSDQSWKPLWQVENYSSRTSGGMITRPDYPLTDPDPFHILAQPVTTDRVRIRAVTGDGSYSLSEIQFLAADHYAIDLNAGESISAVLTNQRAGQLSLDLVDETGLVLAVGSSGFLNASRAISDFVAPAAGRYYWRVSGDVDYSLVLTRSAIFDLEPNDDAATAPFLGVDTAALGHVWRTLNEGFESGAIPGPGWEISHSSGVGRVRVTDEFGAAEGGYALVMDSSATNIWVVNEAIWTVDLAGATTAGLSFRHRSFGSESNNTMPVTHNGRSFSDGVAFSVDGISWYRIWTPVLSNSWGTTTIDLVAQAATHGVTLGEQVRIKFQQYGPQPMPQSGRAWDAIALTTDAARDEYWLDVNAGNALTIVTTTPGGGSGQPDNSLVPRLQLFAPDGGEIGSNVGGASDGRNAQLSHAAAVTGSYRVRVSAASGAGAYTLRSEGSTASPTLDVVSTLPTSGTRLAAFPSHYLVKLSRGVSAPSVGVADLKIIRPDGSERLADSVELVDGETIRFGIGSAAATDGAYQFIIDGGNFSSLGGILSEPFSGSLILDTESPVVVQSSIAEGGTIDVGQLTWTVVFDEALATPGLGPEDVVLTGSSGTKNPTTFLYDADTRTLTVTFTGIVEGSHSLALISGPTAFRDEVGNLLDGDRNGTGGDPFVIGFTADISTVAFTAPFEPIEPFGSLIHAATHQGIFAQVGDTDVLTLVPDQGQTISLLLTPRDPSILASVELLGPSGSLGIVTATAAGQALLLQSVTVAEAGEYRIRATNQAGSGAFDLRVVLNAAIELESGVAGPTNNDLAGAQPLGTSTVALGGEADRLAVIGIADGVQPDFYSWELTAGEMATVVVHGESRAAARLELFDAAGNRLAIGATGAPNVDEYIRWFRAPASGTYYARVSGMADKAYSLVVTRNADFEIEPNGDLETAAVSLAYVDTVLGYVGKGGASGNNGTIDVAILAAEGTTAWINDVRNKLLNLGWFDSVTVINVISSTPSLETLLAFDSVQVWSDSTFQNATLMGNVLADYVDAGGGVVIQTFATANGYAPLGRWASGGYQPMVPGGVTSGGSLTLGTVADPGHPIMDGVSSFVGGSSSYRGAGTLAAGSNLIASWSNGTPLIAELMTFEGPVVTLNFFPPSSDQRSDFWLANTDGDLLMGNSLLYVAGANDRVDFFVVPASQGTELRLETSTPAGEAGQFVNLLDPAFEFRSPAGALVAHANVAGNESLVHQPSLSGDYSLAVSGQQEPGTYVLRATGLAASTRPLTVISTNPPNEALLNSYPTRYRLSFSEAVLLTSLQPNDLLVDGVAATAVNVIDAFTIEFEIATADTGDGRYDVEVAAGAITSLSGRSLEAFNATFDYDATNPTVTASSLSEGQVVAPGTLVYQVQFSEELATAGLGAEDVTLVEAFSGLAWSPAGFAYDPATSVATITFDDLPEGQFTLTLLTSATAFRDRRDNLLDGNGDQSAGDPYVLRFGVDRETSPFPVPLAILAPAGGLIHSGIVVGAANAAGDLDTFTLDLDADQVLSLVLAPRVPTLRLGLTLIAPDGATLGTVQAAEAGKPIFLQSLPVAVGGIYRIVVSSLAGAGQYDLRVLLNSAIEEEVFTGVANNTISTAQNLGTSQISVGNGSQRAAVVGSISSGNPDFYAVDLTAGDVVSWFANDLAGAVTLLELYDAEGRRLALADRGTSDGPLGVIEFVVPQSGTYHTRVQGVGDYTLLVVRNTDFEWAEDVYFSDFESGADGRWSTTATDNTVAAFSRFLGRFNNGGTILTLDTQPGQVHWLEFDLMVLDSWEGSGPANGPDFFNVDIAGTRAFQHTFDNQGGGQSYPKAPDVGGQNFGWSSWNDAIYRGIRIPFIATGATTQIRFYDGGLQSLANESWGLDNVRVQTRDPIATGRVLGHLSGEIDAYTFVAQEGDSLFLYTTTPGDGAGEPSNNLDTSLRLYGPAGLLVGLGEAGAPQGDGRNAGLAYVVPQGAGGLYTIQVQGTGRGAYSLNLRGASGWASPLPEVIATDPRNAQPFFSPPQTLDLVFSQALKLDTIGVSDLVLDGGATVTGVEVLDSHTVRFLLDVPAVEGTYTYALAAGGILDLQGDANVAYQGTFLIDRAGPRVVAQIPAAQTSAPFTELIFDFDEAITANSFTITDVTLFTGPGGTNLLSQVTGIVVSGNRATVRFNGQAAQGTYVMRIGPNIEDLVGNRMDQDGDGTGGETTDSYVATVNLQSADLTVTTVTLPTTGVLGAPLAVSWTVSNSGTDPALEGWKDQLWLSKDATLDSQDLPLLVQPIAAPSGSVPLGVNQSYTRNLSVQLPLNASLGSGTYYILVKTDAESRQPENNENNNIGFDTILLNLPPLPDLVVSEIDAPSEAFSGQTIQYSWTITNRGTGPATGTWYDRVLLSADQAVGSDLLLGDFSFTGTLAAGESIVRTQSYRPPISLEGNRWFIMQTDRGNAIFEHALEGNNTTVSGSPMGIRLSPYANLQVTQVTPPADAFSSQQTVVEWVVTNGGTGSTSAPVWYDDVWLSTDDLLDDADIRVGRVQNASYLAAGESYRNSLAVTLPQGIQGDYWFIIRTDSQNQVFEAVFENDNVGVGAKTRVTMTPPPDLRVTGIMGPDLAFSNQRVTVSYTVLNDDTTPGAGGRTLQSSWTDRIYLSSSPTQLVGAFTLANVQRSAALNPGQSYVHTQEVTIPVSIEGDWYLFVQTDVGNQVFEHIFDNNNLEVRRDEGLQPRPTRITLTPPDLEVDFVDVPAVAQSGRPLTFDYQVTNYGVAATPNTYWVDHYYLSTDRTLGANDVSLGSLARYGSLDVFGSANASYARNPTLTIPNGLAGDFYLLVKTDASNLVFEGPPDSAGESNNVTSSGRLMRVVSNPPDLTVVTDSFLAPATVAAGAIMRASWVEQNQGTGSVGSGTWRTRVYASRDEIPSVDDVMLASFNRSGDLTPGGSRSWLDQPITIPIDLVGNVYLYVRVDAINEIYEGDGEGNNVSQFIPVTVLQDVADLQVTTIDPLTGPIRAGDLITLRWTVTNAGTGQTDALSWQDRIVLSSDHIVSSNDRLLGTFSRTSPLDAGGSYIASMTVGVPVDLAGPQFLIVWTDSTNRVFEGVAEGNNTRWIGLGQDSGDPADPGPILPEDPDSLPDLELSDVAAPVEAYTGQPFTINWTVTNRGAATSGSWFDQVYLSLDQVFDPQADISIGSVNGASLAAGASYTRTATFDIPRGISGPFYVFVASDRNDRLRESNELNNVGYDRESMLVQLTPPADLVVGTITVPETAAPGMNASITYTVRNQGQDLALGRWYDSLFISADATWDIGDAFFGRVLHDGNVAGGSSYSHTLTAPLPGVLPGDYHVIIRSDIFNQVAESDEANNIGASLDRVDIDLALLQLGVTETGQLDAGRSVYYRTEALTAGDTIRLRFDGPTDAFSELYVRHGAMPTRNEYDWAANEPFQIRQDIILPVEQGGVYYVMGYRTSVATAADYSLRAEIIPFSVLGVDAAQVGNAAQATVKISGARFDATTEFYVLHDEYGALRAEQVFLQDSATAYATFDFRQAEPGVYTVGAYDPAKDLLATLDDALTVIVGSGYHIETQGRGPTVIAPNRNNRFEILYGNDGDGDAMAPLLIATSLTGTPMGFNAGALTAGAPLQILGASADGPLDILRPGSINSVPIYYRSGSAAVGVDVRVSYYTHDDNTPINPQQWEQIKASVKPASIGESDWNGFWANIPARIGNTWGQYVRFLNRVETILAEPGEPERDVRKLFEQLYNQNPNYLPTLSVSGQLLDSQTDSPIAGVEVSLYERAGNQVILVGSSITQADGSFSMSVPDEGVYEFTLSESHFLDMDRDAIAATTPFALAISSNEDVAGVRLYAVAAALEATITEDAEASLALASNGQAHLAWTRDGVVWHAVHDGVAWGQAKPISYTTASHVKLTYAANLIDGESPGLIAVWEQGSDNETEIFYAIAAILPDGTVAWMDPLQLTENSIKDAGVEVAVLPGGQVLFTYTRSDHAIQDDTDLYFEVLQVAALPNSFDRDPVVAIAPDSLGDGVKIAFGKETKKIKLFGLQVSGKFSGEAALVASGCFIYGSAKVNAELVFDGQELKTSFVGDGQYKTSYACLEGSEECEYSFKDGKLSWSVGAKVDWKNGLVHMIRYFGIQGRVAAWILEAAQNAAAKLGGFKFEAGISVQGNARFSELSYTGADPLESPSKFLQPDSVANAGFEFSFGPYIKAGYEGELEGKVSGTVNVKVEVVPDFKLKELSGSVALEVKYPSGRFWKTTFTAGFFQDGITSLGVDHPLSGLIRQEFTEIQVANLMRLFDQGELPVPEGMIIEWGYDPSKMIGTGNVYGANSIFSSVATDVLRDGAPSTSVGPYGTVTMAWVRDRDPFGGSIGNTIWTAVYEEGQGWSAPTELPETLGFNNGVEILHDGNGNPLLVWSRADSTNFDPAATHVDFLNLYEDRDLHFSVFVGGAWTTPRPIEARAGRDAELSVTKTPSGEVVAVWLNEPVAGNDQLLTASWDGASWSVVTQITTASHISNPDVGVVGGRVVSFWEENISPEAGVKMRGLYHSTLVDGWSAPQRFAPGLAPLPEALAAIPAWAGGGLAGVVAGSRAALLPQGGSFVNQFFTPPEECCECDEIDTVYRGTNENCGFTVEYDEENCKKIIIYKPCVPPPVDPNDIIGPEGYGDPNWIRADLPLDYKIRFENDPIFAKAPAQKVVITQTLDSDLDFRTFRLGDFGFGDLLIPVPENRAFYSTRIDLIEERGYFVDFTAGVNVQTGEVTWTLVTIDPTTGEQPLDPLIGFLAVNDELGSGEGYVTYSIRVKRTAITGDVVDAEARIVFDTESPVDTPPIFNTLDAVKPASHVEALPSTVNQNAFVVSWTGDDDAGGSGLAAFNIFVSANGGPFTPWLLGTQLTTAEFVGSSGSRYEFFSMAFDNAGNQELAPDRSDTVTVTPGGLATLGDRVWHDLDANGVQDDGEPGVPNVTVRLYFADQSEPLATTTTDENGQYAFANLALTESYVLEFVAPSGFAFTRSKAGPSDALDSDVNIATGRTVVFAPIDGLNVNWDAGVIELGSLGGGVWRDANANGTREDGEAWLPGQVVYLDINGDGKWDEGEPTRTTDAAGQYRFENVRPGLHVVRQILPAGWEQTHPGPGGATAINLTGSTVPLYTPALLQVAESSAGQYSLAGPSNAERLARIFDALAARGDAVWPILSQADDPRDLNADGLITPLDALIVINAIAAAEQAPIPSSLAEGPSSVGVADAQRLIGLDALRGDARFANLDGRGLSVVVIDTGLESQHPFFGDDADGDGVADRIVYQYDFAGGDGDAADPSGHGTHVTSIIASQDSRYPGIAAGVNIIHLKVFSDAGRGSFGYLEQALQWVISNVDAYDIAAVNLSLGDGQNWSQAVGLYGVSDELAALDGLGVITVSAAGNSFASFSGREGLAYPAADPHSLAVGAVWDGDRGLQTFGTFGTDYTTAADRVTSFSQRHGELLDALAPGALIAAAGLNGGVATMRGTSMAAPFVTGAAVLAQQLALEQHGSRLNAAQFRALLRSSGTAIVDGDDEDFDVRATGDTFFRLDLLRLAESLLDYVPPTGNGGVNTGGGQSGGSIGTLDGSFAYFVQLDQGEDREQIDFGIRPIAVPRPTVTGELIQNAMSQRSFVDRFEIGFSSPVNLGDLITAGTIGEAVSIVNLGVNADVDADQTLPLAANQFRYEYDEATETSRLIWSLDAFANRGLSLENGYFRVTLDSERITSPAGGQLQGNGAGIDGTDYAFDFHRLLGDADGDAMVNANDMGLVNSVLGTTPASKNWNANADLDRDGRVTVRDRVLVGRGNGTAILGASGSSFTGLNAASVGGVTSQTASLIEAQFDVQGVWLDVNGDGLVSPWDALLAINQIQRQAASGAASWVDEPLESATWLPDVDFDGRVDLRDVASILDHLAAVSRRAVEGLGANGVATWIDSPADPWAAADDFLPPSMGPRITAVTDSGNATDEQDEWSSTLELLATESARRGGEVITRQP